MSITGGLPDTVLPPEPDDATARLEQAMNEPPQRRRDAVADQVRQLVEDASEALSERLEPMSSFSAEVEAVVEASSLAS